MPGSFLSVTVPKRPRHEDNFQETEMGHLLSEGQHTRGLKDVEEGKKDIVKRKDNLNRVLSSTTLNVPSPMRKTR